MLSDDEIARIIHSGSGSVGTTIEHLVAAANRAGGHDNITVLLLAIGAAGKCGQKESQQRNTKKGCSRKTGTPFLLSKYCDKALHVFSQGEQLSCTTAAKRNPESLSFPGYIPFSPINRQAAYLFVT